MKEQLISFETAKLAKEKGFDNSGNNSFYNSEGKLVSKITGLVTDFYCHSSTQSLLQKWLREKYRIDIYCYPNYDIKGVTFQINLYTDPYVNFKNVNHFYKGGFKTYEQALEKGLQEALKLIKL